ncbi:MAG: hypothetical protein DKM22_01475 [Candidatus Melainabacteria bacterium]|nr:MAG: hypothetical protein DKM22_01475 [Candidatus Melainabacteria bacterium]
MKENLKRVLGYFFIVISIVLFIFNFKTNETKIDLPYFGGVFNKVIVNIQTQNTGDIYINDEKLNYANGVYFKEYIGKVKNLKISKPVNNVELFIGHKFYGINNVKNIDLTSGNFINYRGVFTECKIFILSLFMLPSLYFVPYLFLFSALLLINPKKIHLKALLTITIIIAFFLRFCNLTEYPMWIDEVFTMLYAKSSFSNLFNDYCNPPLIYIIAKLWTIVSYTEVWARLFSVIMGVCGVWSLYYLLKNKINERTALTGAILSCFSFWGIYYSQELRCYATLMFLAPLCTNFMLNFLESKKDKDLIIFAIFSAIIVNLHLYGILFVVSNFVYCLWKGKSSRIKLFLANCFVMLTFLPYFFVTLLPKSILGTNELKGNLIVEIIKSIGLFYVLAFVLIALLLFFVIFKRNSFFKLIKMKELSKEKNFFIYCLFTIVFVWLLSLLISAFRLIIYYRYYSILYPYILAMISIVIAYNYKVEYKNVLLSFLILLSVIFQFKVNFPPSVRYGNFYDVIKFENEKACVVLDYLTYYAKYYKVKSAKNILYNSFNPRDIEKGTTVYFYSFKEGDKSELSMFDNRVVINLPDNAKVIKVRF